MRSSALFHDPIPAWGRRSGAGRNLGRGPGSGAGQAVRLGDEAFAGDDTLEMLELAQRGEIDEYGELVLDVEQSGPRDRRAEARAYLDEAMVRARQLVRPGEASEGEDLFPTRNPAIDGLLAGGVARGEMVEVVGWRSSGRFSLALSLLAAATQAGESAALVDLGDHLDPESAAAAGVDLERLLWMRPEHVKQALGCAEMVLGAGFSLVVLELGTPPLPGGRGAEAAWLRLQRAAQSGRSALFVSAPYRASGTAAGAVLELHRGAGGWLADRALGEQRHTSGRPPARHEGSAQRSTRGAASRSARPPRRRPEGAAASDAAAQGAPVSSERPTQADSPKPGMPEFQSSELENAPRTSSRKSSSPLPPRCAALPARQPAPHLLGGLLGAAELAKMRLPRLKRAAQERSRGAGPPSPTPGVADASGTSSGASPWERHARRRKSMEETSGVSGASGASGAFGSIESTGSGDAPGRSVGEVALEMAVRFELRAPSGSVAGLAAPLQTSWTRLRRRSPSARSSTAASPKGRHEEAGDDGGATVVPLASRSVRSATGKVTERIGVKAPEAATDATGAAGATGGGAIGSHEADDEIARSAVGTRGTVSTNPRQAAVAEPTIEYEPSEARRHAIDERFVDLRADLEGAPPAAVAVATDGGAATRDESPCSPSTTAGRRSPPRSRRRASETHRAG